MDTLYYYVLYNRNINKTAERMCVHRNSLSHRLDKIAEITKMTMSNGIMLQNFVLFHQIQLYLKRLKENDHHPA